MLELSRSTEASVRVFEIRQVCWQRIEMVSRSWTLEATLEFPMLPPVPHRQLIALAVNPRLSMAGTSSFGMAGDQRKP